MPKPLPCCQIVQGRRRIALRCLGLAGVFAKREGEPPSLAGDESLPPIYRVREKVIGVQVPQFVPAAAATVAVVAVAVMV